LMAVPSQTIQTVVAKWTAVEDCTKQHRRLAAFTGRVLKKMLLAGVLCWLVLIVTGSWLAHFFRLSSSAPIIAVGATTVVMLAIPVLRGLLQGLQRFAALGTNLLADGMLRLTLGAGILALGWGVSGGVLASAAGGACAFGLALLVLPEVREPKAAGGEPLDLRELKLYSVSTLLNFGAYMALSTVDVIMVKHYFEPADAGQYGAASMVGKAFLFLPFAVANVLFPKASASRARAENPYGLFLKSLALTAAILAASIALAWVLAPLIVITLFGGQFMLPQTLFLIKCFGLAITPLALAYILLQYHLALHSRRFMFLMLADLPLLTGCLMFFHQHLTTILLVVGVNHLLLLAAGFLLTPGRTK
ncbi:oligosaccharide flippase family protein, partial [candidate division FCPU426 bacterium]|nr:oligosaccharide flippase family protein [candidate division FCPU426 bacterium]